MTPNQYWNCELKVWTDDIDSLPYKEWRKLQTQYSGLCTLHSDIKYAHSILEVAAKELGCSEHHYTETLLLPTIRKKQEKLRIAIQEEYDKETKRLHSLKETT